MEDTQRFCKLRPWRQSPASAPAPESAPGRLDRRLREAGTEELLAPGARASRGAGAAGGPAGAAQSVLHRRRSSSCSPSQPRLVSFYEVRRDLALHPRTPEPLALRFVPGLCWRDLMALGLDTRLRPRVRRAADQDSDRAAARARPGREDQPRAPRRPGVLAQLRHDPHPRVISALLDNPRLTEDILAPVVHGAATPGPVLAAIAADRRWSTRPGLQVALARNPNTPPAVALRLLPLLRKPELRTVAHDVRVPEAVRLPGASLARRTTRGMSGDAAI